MTAQQPSPPAAAAPPSAPPVWLRTWQALPLGEQLILIGAALVLLVANYLLAGLLGLGFLPLWYVIPSAQALLLIGLRNLKPGTALGVSYGLILSAIVVTELAPAISDILVFLHQATGAGQTAGELLVDLVTWAGVAVMTAGVVLYWRGGGS
jgi:hypothetical protein